MSIVENNITNHLFNTSFNPFDENLISITRNSSKTGKDFFFNNQEKNFCLSQIHILSLIIKIIKIKIKIKI